MKCSRSLLIQVTASENFHICFLSLTAKSFQTHIVKAALTSLVYRGKDLCINPCRECKPVQPRSGSESLHKLKARKSFQKHILTVTSTSHCYPAISDRHHHPAALFCQKQLAYLAKKASRWVFINCFSQCISSLDWCHCSAFNPISTNNIQLYLTELGSIIPAYSSSNKTGNDCFNYSQQLRKKYPVFFKTNFLYKLKMHIPAYLHTKLSFNRSYVIKKLLYFICPSTSLHHGRFHTCLYSCTA